MKKSCEKAYNAKLPVRPAPCVPNFPKKNGLPMADKKRKVPPPRPPPPNLKSTVRSQSAWNLNQVDALLEWSPPTSPKTSFANEYPKFNQSQSIGGSISSSFSSSTSSLASSKRSFEYETVQFNVSPWSNSNQLIQGNTPSNNPITNLASNNQNTPSSSHVLPQINIPTIIRAQNKATKSKGPSPRVQSPVLNNSPPMPNIPPPSPPKETEFVQTPIGIALYDFPGNQPGDLSLQINDIVYLLRRVNTEWLYGRVDSKEGIFPANFVDIQVPLPEESNMVTALYEFVPQTSNDLHIKPGQTIKVLKKISNEWLFGELNGIQGEFPSNYVDRIPNI